MDRETVGKNIPGATAITRRGFLASAAALACASALAGCDAVGPQVTDPTDYLVEHVRSYDPHGELDVDALGDLGCYQLILTGEMHAIVQNFDVQLMLIRYLNRHWDLRYIVAELGLGASIYLNRYLETGDNALLDDIMNQLSGTASYTVEQRVFYQKLYEYNVGLPDEQKLRVIGLDVDHQGALWLSGLALLLPDTPPEDEVAARLYELIGRLAQEGDYLAAHMLLASEKSVAPDLIDQVFGKQCELARQVIKNFDAALHFYNVLEGDVEWALRDEVMEQNFLYVRERLPFEHFYGQFGSAHVAQHDYVPGEFKDGLPFAARLNADGSPMQGKVCSIPLVYTDENGSVGQNIAAHLTDDLFGAYWGMNLIFDLADEPSPFAQDICLAVRRRDDAVGTLDYYQKMIFVADLTQAEALDEA